MIEWLVKQYVGGKPTFFTFFNVFSDFKKMTFYVFWSCCTRFLEHCWGIHVISPEEEKERLRWEGFAEKEGF